MKDGMYEAIKDFPSQFGFKPQIANAKKLKKAERFIVSGMGGSHLGADLIKMLRPDLDIRIHSDYGLPPLRRDDPGKALLILSSYSGNTEEVLDSLKEGEKKKLRMAAVCVGGKLLALAEKRGIPYVRLPDTGIQPRMALGFSVMGMLALMGEERDLKELAKIQAPLSALGHDSRGQALAYRMKGRIPVIYASEKNRPLAYNWKIKFNETGKIPAFFNVLPEMNHNEMTGFDLAPSTENLSQKFYFVFLKDPEDNARVKKRMEVLRKLFEKRGMPVEEIELNGDRNKYAKAISVLVLADWAAYYTALQYGVEPEQVPMVEEFKRLIA